MERLSPLDAFFLFIEDDTTHMHIATCAIFEGPAPEYRRVASVIADRLASVPRYRQVVRFVPLQLGRPVWVDDPRFDLDFHVRHTALPPPGDDTELKALMGRIMSQPLDRHRPLWEAWMVEGLEHARWALIMKIHHCMADGVSGTDLFAAILDRGTRAELPSADPWQPGPQPSGLHLTLDALWRLALIPYEELRVIGRASAAPRWAFSRLRDVTDGMLSYARRIPPTERNTLVGSIGPHRRWTWASGTLDDVKTIRRAFGGTVNDVIVTAVTGGLRELFLSRGEPTGKLVLRTLIPVSVRAEAEHDTYDNRVSAIFADLPVAIDDPVARLDAVRRQMETLKASHQPIAGEGLTALVGLAPPSALAFAERAAMQILRRVPQHTINTVITNIPGPRSPLALAGREMLECLPFVPIFHGMRVGVAIVSYNGRLAFGVTGDYDTAPDIEVLAGGIESTLAQLVKVAA